MNRAKKGRNRSRGTVQMFENILKLFVSPLDYILVLVQWLPFLFSQSCLSFFPHQPAGVWESYDIIRGLWTNLSHTGAQYSNDWATGISCLTKTTNKIELIWDVVRQLWYWFRVRYLSYKSGLNNCTVICRPKMCYSCSNKMSNIRNKNKSVSNRWKY